MAPTTTGPGSDTPAVFCLAMPVRTGLEFLPTAFQSIADQRADVEVALLDASGDKLVAALAEQSGLHFHHRYHRASDDGQAAAIQIGWDHGTGEYLGWLNADDRLLPGALDIVAATFAAHPEADVVYGQACYLDENGAFLGYFPAFEPSPERLPWSNMICQPAAFLRRSSLARIGGLNTSLHYTMDWDLWLRLYQAGCQFHAIDTVLAAVVNRAESKTNSGQKIRQREISAILKRQAQQPAGLREYFGRLYGEAALGGHSLIWRLIRSGLALRRSLLGRKAAALPAYRRGITPLSNEIQQQCDIVMPVPGHTQNVRLHLFSDRPGSFSILPRVNGQDGDNPAIFTRPMILNGRRQRSGFGGTYHAYHYIGQPILTAAGLLSITLLGPKLWRLIAIEVEPTDAV